jgi:hypothetical protein
MGVEYTAVLAIGKEFTSPSRAEAFLREHGFLTGITEEQIDHDGLEDHVPDGLIFQSLDLYSGGYYYLGIYLCVGSVESFRKDFEDAVETWDRMFNGAVEPQLIHTVRYH